MTLMMPIKEEISQSCPSIPLHNPRHRWQSAIQTKINLTTHSENSKILQILIQTKETSPVDQSLI